MDYQKLFSVPSLTISLVILIFSALWWANYSTWKANTNNTTTQATRDTTLLFSVLTPLVAAIGIYYGYKNMKMQASLKVLEVVIPLVFAILVLANRNNGTSSNKNLNEAITVFAGLTTALIALVILIVMYQRFRLRNYIPNMI
jgi:C4-dicarboxylate transporter